MTRVDSASSITYAADRRRRPADPRCLDTAIAIGAAVFGGILARTCYMGLVLGTSLGVIDRSAMSGSKLDRWRGGNRCGDCRHGIGLSRRSGPGPFAHVVAMAHATTLR